MLSSGDVSRIKTIGGWKPFAETGEQLLLKVTSGPRKSVGGVTALVQYVSRAGQDGEHGRLDLTDEFGETIPHTEIKSALAGWNLIADRDNLRPAARELVDQGESIRVLAERDRYWRNQAYHLVWSQTTEGTHLTESELEARMREAVREFAFDEFAQHGHKVLWAVHQDHPGRPHVHLIVQARSKGAKGKQLRLDPDRLADMRARLAQIGRSVDLPVLSERREDRGQLLDKVLDGDVALRTNRKRVRYDKDTSLAKQVPFWLQEEGAGFLERKKSSRKSGARSGGGVKPDLNVRPKPPKDVPEHFHPLFDCFTRIYKNPQKALTSFFKMACGSGEGPKHQALSIWYLGKQPIAFGDLISTDVESLKNATNEARKIRTFPNVDWITQPHNADAIQEALDAVARQRRYQRDRLIIVKGLGSLRRRMRDENVQGPNLELVRTRMAYVRDYTPGHSTEPVNPQPALQRVVKFFRPKRTPTR